ncbi:hypothetical protein [Streptomyces sp. cg35]|uniref:hypothetical protein n=1 Tax=Streptomyces sp. cg35 TaxID=3421650 RepID=UPI003D17E520
MTRKTRKTPGGGSNPALAPNKETLRVGDGVAPPAAAATAPAAKEKPKRVPFGSYIDPELQKELRVACAVQGIEIRDALDQALRSWIAQNKA